MNQSFGKFIISGEHSVVYGEPAIVCELKKSITIKIVDSNTKVEQSGYEKFILDLFFNKYKVDVNKILLEISSELPQKSGLGSSAAFAHALLKGLSSYFKIKISKDEMFNLVYESEIFMHKNPSGIDPFAVVYGGCNLFKKNLTTKKFENQKIVLNKEYNFLLVNSGQATESTGEMVLMVEKLLKTDSSKKAIISSIGRITTQIKRDLTDGTFTGKLLTKNQEELEKLNIVGKQAKDIIKEFVNLGAHAKVTGAGGIKSGSGWILVYSDDLSKIEDTCDQNSWEYIKTRV